MFPSNILESYFLMQQVESPKAQDILVDVGAGNGIEIYLNGKSVMKHLKPLPLQVPRGKGAATVSKRQ